MYLPRYLKLSSLRYVVLLPICLLLIVLSSTLSVGAKPTNVWQPGVQLTPKGWTASTKGGLGWSMAFERSDMQDTLVVGAPFKDNSKGAAEVFVSTDKGATWTQQAELTDSKGQAKDFFGAAVVIRGDTVLVGAPYKDKYTGEVEVFQRTGTTWKQQVLPSPTGIKAGDLFGFAIALTPKQSTQSSSGIRARQVIPPFMGIITAPGAVNDAGESFWFSFDDSWLFKPLNTGVRPEGKIFLGGKVEIENSGNADNPYVVTETAPGISAFTGKAVPAESNIVFQFQVNAKGEATNTAILKLVDADGKPISSPVYWAHTIVSGDTNTLEVGSKDIVQDYQRDGNTFKPADKQPKRDPLEGIDSSRICEQYHQYLEAREIVEEKNFVQLIIYALDGTKVINYEHLLTPKWQQEGHPEHYKPLEFGPACDELGVAGADLATGTELIEVFRDIVK
jgi:FG-GAP repeat